MSCPLKRLSDTDFLSLQWLLYCNNKPNNHVWVPPVKIKWMILIDAPTQNAMRFSHLCPYLQFQNCFWLGTTPRRCRFNVHAKDFFLYPDTRDQSSLHAGSLAWNGALKRKCSLSNYFEKHVTGKISASLLCKN